jgi:hypothetical protein
VALGERPCPLRSGALAPAGDGSQVSTTNCTQRTQLCNFRLEKGRKKWNAPNTRGMNSNHAGTNIRNCSASTVATVFAHLCVFIKKKLEGSFFQ